MIAVVCVWSGLVLSALGLVSLVRPPRLLGIGSRRRAAGVVAAGVLVAALGWSLPAPELRVAAPASRLDEFSPAYQFSEQHAVEVAASPAQVFRAIREVTADEILLFRTLTWIRRLGQPGPESILDAPERRPILEVATRTSFLLLAEEPDRELVVGTLVLAPPGFRPREHPTAADFKRLSAPGFAKAVMGFRVEPLTGGGSRVSTETRVFATDPASCRRFAAYWRVIYPGSALIRRMWLRAIRQRAERTRAEERSGELARAGY